jgi:hypothetical protein
MPARAGLIFTNFSPSNPILVMPVGDSITDDCEESGAWRDPLQPLLDSGGIPFNFVGREMTSPVTNASFTKVHHEGYCGAVIAAPGVSQPTHIYTAGENYLENIVPGAMATNQSDLMLILIGANDIGHGRDPTNTAQFDMPNLLDLIFSNNPAENVILAKITTLSNASLGYNAFAANVPIYNAQLQAMVNQHRLAGQNVRLADMFSVVNYDTMFNIDHLHPNPIGLAAIAKEWYTRIETIMGGTNEITSQLIYGGDTWDYSDQGIDYGTNWSQPGFDDTGWSNGVGRFGYGEAADATVVGFGGVKTNRNITTYFRKKIVVPWNQYYTNLNFRLTQTGGSVVWLNGQEMYRTNLPPGPISYTNRASNSVTLDPEYIYFQTNIAQTLQPGTNVIGVEVHLNSPSRLILGFDMELLGGAVIMPPPTLSATVNSANIVLTWPTTNSYGFNLYSSPSISSPNWQPVTSILQTNGNQITTSVGLGPNSGFFQLQQVNH